MLTDIQTNETICSNIGLARKAGSGEWVYMIWAFLPLLVFVLIFGFTGIERDQMSISPPAAPTPINLAAASQSAQEFILYRNAVTAYAASHFNTGSYPASPASPSALGLSSAVASALPADAFYILAYPAKSGTITPSDQASANRGYYVCVWMKVPVGTITQTVDQLGGDLTIGTVVANDNWLQAGPNGQVLPIPPTCLAGMDLSTGMPVTPPVGDMISVVGMTESTAVVGGGS